MGQAGPRRAVPKPGPSPKFPVPSLVTPCPFLLPAHRSHHPRLREDRVLEDISWLPPVPAQAVWLPL